jgi:vancomycin resistance protein YoaR
VQYFRRALAVHPPPETQSGDPLAPLPAPARTAVARAWKEQRIWVIATGVLGALLLLVLGALYERIDHRDEIIDGVEVAGEDLSGLPETEALHRIEDLGVRLAQQPVHAHAGRHDLVLDPAAVGYSVDAEATVRAARRQGRSANPLDALPGVLLRRARADEVPLVVTYDPDKLSDVLDTWVGETGSGLIDGDLRFDGAHVAEVRPRAGIGIDRDEAARRIRHAFGSGGASIGTLEIGPTRPSIDLPEVRRAARHARRILAAPVTVRAGDATATIEPEQLGTALRTHHSGRRLSLRVDQNALRVLLAPMLLEVEHPPADAGFAIEGNTVSVIPAVDGVAVRLAPVGRAIADGRHRVTAAVSTTPPEKTTEWAEGLKITELVSSYTTNHPCCQPRVTNIHTAADVIDGTILLPGETFSLNEALGPRTTDKGYVSAPGIGANLEFEDSVGGGVSQLSTTLYNATFFGCYEDITHTVHALYISRYPMGREATLNYPSIDNKFRNDTSAGVLIRTYYSGGSITVALYGSKEGRRCDAEGPNILETIPIETEYVDDPALPIGTERRLTPGSTGYVVENFRVIHRDGQPDRRERYVERYAMARSKVARGTGPPPAPTPPPTPAPTPAPVPPATPPAT